jgi:hypothetical protein
MSLDFFPGGVPARRPWARGLLHAAVLLPLPLLALLTLTPGGPAFEPQALLAAPPVQDRYQGPFLISDFAELARLEKCLHPLQDNPPPMPSDLAPGDSGVAALLNGWERVGRTARRHKSTLDYFLGFGF